MSQIIAEGKGKPRPNRSSSRKRPSSHVRTERELGNPEVSTTSGEPGESWKTARSEEAPPPSVLSDVLVQRRNRARQEPVLETDAGDCGSAVLTNAYQLEGSDITTTQVASSRRLARKE
jgi:hypothetical protein